MRTKCLDIEDVVDVSIEMKAVTSSIPARSLRKGHQFNPERGADVGKWMVTTTAPSSAIESTLCLPTSVILLMVTAECCCIRLFEFQCHRSSFAVSI